MYSVNEYEGIVHLQLTLSNPSSFTETVQVISNDVTATGMLNCADTLYVHSCICMYVYVNLFICTFITCVHTYTYIYRSTYIRVCCIVTGGGDDYDSGLYNVTFPIGSTNATFGIVINNDGILEGTEAFTLLISQFTSNLTVGTSNESTVHIINTNSKLLLYVCTYVH